MDKWRVGAVVIQIGFQAGKLQALKGGAVFGQEGIPANGPMVAAGKQGRRVTAPQRHLRKKRKSGWGLSSRHRRPAFSQSCVQVNIGFTSPATTRLNVVL